MRGAIVVVVKGYPRLSETFIAQELLGLERAGLTLKIFSMRHPTDPIAHAIHRQIEAPVTYLPEYLYQEPLRVLRALVRCRQLPGFSRALRAWLSDLGRDFSPNRFRRFGQAAVLAVEMPADAKWLHAHFIHTPAAVTRYASLLTGMRWSCSAHAKDIWTSRDWELHSNLASMQWVATCTGAGRDKLVSLASEPTKVHLIYHGLDLDRFPPTPRPASTRAGGTATGPVRLLTVGRAVEKKGLDVLLEALAKLSAELHWSLTHIGGGPELKKLKRRAKALGLAGRVTWIGAQDQHVVLAAYRGADLFVLPCRIAGNGDRDGLPNVLIEAQSQGLACISTAISGVPELISDGETGVLVRPEDPEALGAAVARLIVDPALRDRLGAAAERRVRERFDM
ncbi:MAG TPA: glycosyltransferase family 4 protein, partial [Hyphomicrobiaceae bacterium]|nr:glycosyltransferase family 4 protein [Hyphomicrobiaceae bacterium]